MASRLRTVAWILLAVSVACAVPQSLARKKEKSPEASATEQKRAVHALNRLAFGPRPGEVQQVLAMGVDNYASNEELFGPLFAEPEMTAQTGSVLALVRRAGLPTRSVHVAATRAAAASPGPSVCRSPRGRARNR